MTHRILEVGLTMAVIVPVVLIDSLINKPVAPTKVEIFAIADPVTFTAKPLAKKYLYRTSKKISLDDREFHCLAKNIYHEAGIENYKGKVAVAQITFNRLYDGKWGNNICKVVYAKSQFSWTLNRNKVSEKPRGDLWNDSVAAARDYLNGIRIQGLDHSMFYHADYITPPKWASANNRVNQIGRHVFYALN
jgi:spore germination cell wall hydrolase CwlJ-like protein